MSEISNSVLIQSLSVAELDAMIGRAVEKRMQAFYEKIKPRQAELVKRKEAARMLGISLPTIDAYARHGLLRKKYIGGLVYFEKGEILSLKGG